MLTSMGFAQSNFSKEDIEKKISTIIKEEKVPDQKLFYFYSLAARELNKNQETDLAIKYYKKAIIIKDIESKDKIKTMIELGFLYLKLEKYNELKNLTADIDLYQKNNKQLASSNNYLIHTLNYFKVVSQKDRLVKEAIGKEYKYFFETKYNDVIVSRELEIRMKRSLYKEAYDLYQGQNPKQNGYYDYLLSYDLLNVILKKNSSKTSCYIPKDNKSSKDLLVELCEAVNKIISKKPLVKSDKDIILKRLKSNSSYSYLLPATTKIFTDESL